MRGWITLDSLAMEADLRVVDKDEWDGPVKVLNCAVSAWNGAIIEQCNWSLTYDMACHIAMDQARDLIKRREKTIQDNYPATHKLALAGQYPEQASVYDPFVTMSNSYTSLLKDIQAAKECIKKIKSEGPTTYRMDKA